MTRPDLECFGDQEFEDSLEPMHLIRRAEAVARAGGLMLGAGTSALRVRQLMRRCALALGLTRLEASIGFTELTMTVERRGVFRTMVTQVRRPEVNAHRIALLQQLSNRMPKQITATELHSRLDAIEQQPRLYPAWLRGLLVALACAAIALLAGGGVREAVTVIPASGAAYLMFRRLGRWQLNHLAVVVSSASTASAVYLLGAAGLTWLLGEPSGRLAAGFVCASIFLIPGFPLVTAGMDLTRLDLTAGVTRTAYAAMILISITIGVWVVARLGGVTAFPVPGALLEPPWLWLLRVGASFVAVFGWAFMLNSPLRTALVSAVIGVGGNAIRLAMTDAQVADHVAVFTGCVVMGLACALLGRLFGVEKIIMTVPTLLVMAPGSSALRTLLYFDAGDIGHAVAQGIATVLGVIAMVAGLAAARMLTDPEWIFTRDDPPVIRVGVPRMRRKPRRR
ncbi:MAG: threonine/serine exporter family protein [Propionibacteriaceae bacterium]|nr:threonine/serine exporter family protein [Propionibacteriaceae bacterium]